MPLPTDVRAAMFELFDQGLSNASVARELGLHRGVVIAYNKIYRRERGLPQRAPSGGRAYDAALPEWDEQEGEPKGVDLVKEERERAARRAYETEVKEAVKETAFRTFLGDLVRENVRPMPAAAAPRAPGAGKAHLRYPFLWLSDWHFEELVRPEGVLGLNSYDIPTACRRVWRVVRAVCDWKRDLEAAGRFKVPELVVGLGGDFMTGTLHGSERHSDAPNVVRASLACGDLVALALRDLAATFPRVRVVGVVGNHGRLPDDRKVPTKDPTRSWDYLAYQVARRRLEAQTNTEWHLPEAYGALFEVGGHLCYQAHGNFIPNNLGVVGYGVRRFAASLAANLNSAGKSLKYAFMGHWHQSNASEFAGIEVFIGPSLIGTQDYSFLSGGAVNRPAQELHVFDPDLGHVTRERLYGESPRGAEGTYEVEV